MSAAETAAALSAHAPRGAGSDGERRAAAWLTAEIRAGGRAARTEVFWCRPHGTLAQAWHVALALAASLVMVSEPVVGGLLALAALICVGLDALTGVSPGRRLTPEHASQNVVSDPDPASEPSARDPVWLVVTAAYDAGRRGPLDAAAVRRARGRLRQRAAGGRLALGWQGWLAVGCAWLVAVAVVRHQGATGSVITGAQIVDTVALLVALAALVQRAGTPVDSTGHDALAAGVALALVQALDAAPPPGLRVTLLLQGAGTPEAIGLRRHVRAHRRRLRAGPVAVLGIGPCVGGAPRWYLSDGPLWPLRAHARLRALAAAAGGPGHRGRGGGPALPARLAGLPAIAIGCPSDDPRGDGPPAVDALLALALALTDALGLAPRADT